MGSNKFQRSMQFSEYDESVNRYDEFIEAEDIFIKDKSSQLSDDGEIKEESTDKYAAKEDKKPTGWKDIAIIGVSGRFPGANNVKEFWSNLAVGVSSIKPVPIERWDISEFYDADVMNKEKTYLNMGGFIDNSDKFDSLFFNISGKEAELSDPQQRLFLEESWHALEDAGYTGEVLSEAKCGVFVGVKEGDYQICLSEVGAAHEAQAFWGNDTSIVPARLSYFLNLRGPSIAVNTACSSSLTAIHMACESICIGKCDMAVAGGVFVSHTPGGYIIASNASMLSHDGKCKAFDDRADGFVPGEAVGAIVLKPLDKALADGDYIYAVIKGSGINQDGRTNGITAPSRRAQSELEQEVYEKAGVSPETIGYVETHGTGTKLGDPIEFEALTDSFKKYTAKTEFCAIGSVKTNIGHAAAAAGVASMIKVIMALGNKKIPPSLNFEKPNTFIKFDGSPFFVNTGLIDWNHQEGQPRRAAVSSFGFSGTNVHILLEEFKMDDHIGEEISLPCYCIPLSAKTREALQKKAIDLIKWLEEEGEKYPMCRIAYMLQAGREHYSYRIAFMAEDGNSLLQQLKGFDVGAINECAVENAVGEADTPTSVYTPDIRQGMKAEDYKKEIFNVIMRYSEGENVNWDILYYGSTPLKVPMPLYPFARQTFWVPGTILPERKSVNALHPLIDSVLPRLLDHEVVYSKMLSHKDTIVSHHQVKSRLLLPGVAYLEMANAAAKLLDKDMNIQLKRVVWLTPVVVEKNLDKQLNISLRKKDNYYEFEVTGGNGEVLHSKGEVHPVVTDSIQQYVPVEEIKANLDTEIDKDELYNRFQRLGLDYGEYLKSVSHIWSNGREVLAALELTQSFVEELNEYTYHPAIMDGSIQAVIGLVKGDEMDASGPRLPFSVDNVTLLNPLKSTGYVYIKPVDEEHFNLVILDASGLVCVKMENLTLRRYKNRDEAYLFKPEWVEESLPSTYSPSMECKKVVIVYSRDGAKLKELIQTQHAEAEVYEILLDDGKGALSPTCREISYCVQDSFHNCEEFFRGTDTIYFLGGIQSRIPEIDDIEFLKQSQEVGVLSLYRLVKALNMWGARNESLKFKIVTNNAFGLYQSDMCNPYAGSIQGFALSMAKEYSHWEVSCLDIDISELDHPAFPELRDGWIRQVINEPGYESGKNVLLRKRKRYVRCFAPVELPEAETLPFRNNGVYLILGGAGGIGLELALYLAETVKARLILIGRSALKPEQESKINRIRSFGGEAVYLQADGTDYDSMLRVVATAKEKFGHINGAFHSAIVLKDKTLANMDEDTFRAALAPKVDASVVLYKVLQNEHMDFLVYFSSIQSFTGNAGQANYAAGCTFKDAYADVLGKKAPFKVRTINWGYWGTVGIVSSEQHYKRFTSQGAISITPQEGFNALSRIISAPVGQIMPFKARKDILDLMGVNWNNKIEFQKLKTHSCIGTVLGKLAINDTNASGTGMEEAFKELEGYGRSLLLGYFRNSGFLLHVNEQYSISQMREGMGIIPEYYRLFNALIEILKDAGWIRVDGQTITTLYPLENVPIANQAEKDRLSALYPDMEAHLNLLWVCINAFGDVLSGKVNHMEIMFPAGSTALVEKIYKGDQMSDYFNSLTAKMIKSCVEEHYKNDPKAEVKIVEVGAGTGGTSAFVLKALNEVKDKVKIQYFYTDISNGFTRYAEKSFGLQYPFIEFKLLNIEEDPTSQGFMAGSIDIAFASNVLHATKSIPNTLNQIKKLLKVNGLLIINEATQKQDFGTLTFGLTGGWWLFDDEQNRISNSPLLNPRGWINILKNQGFDKTHTFGVPGMESKLSYQSIIVAESNGEIRTLPVSHKVEYVDGKDVLPKFEPITLKKSSPEVGVTSVKVSGESLFERTIDYLKAVFAEVLRVKKGDIETNATFERYGIDSLIVMEITKRLEKDFKKLSATLLFENPTIDKLADYFLKEKHDVIAELFGREVSSATTGNMNVFNTDSLFSAKKAEEVQTTSQASDVFRKADVRQNDDIAIIGISGRYPLADSLEEFWQNLKQGRNCITEIPRERWNCDEYFQPGSSEPGKSYSKWGGFIKDHDKFDTFFFNISPIEAEAMDPQERIFLETAWAAMEDAGYSRHNLDSMDSQVGVFVGVMNGNYESFGGEEWGKDNFTGAHSAYWSVANRVSYFFNLQGPSMAIDTACSSSLTAIHLACESIKRGECKAAIAGGVNLILHPMHYARLTGMKMLSKGGECKSFGDGADGFVDGEGVGAVLLKPLDKAREDGDNIYAVIKGSFINSGGKTSGYTVPSPNAQSRLIEEALKRSGVEPISISYVEAHGTGTALGDPIEITGLKKAFHACTNNPEAAQLLNTQYCAIGSVKSNIGHLESASGIAGLTKLVLMFKYKKLTASINSEVLNPKIDFKDSPFYVIHKPIEWQRPKHIIESVSYEYPRRAGLSSFGAGGANAHVILEEYEDLRSRAENNEEQIIVLSARNQSRLHEYVIRLKEYVDSLLKNEATCCSTEDGVNSQIQEELLKAAAAILEVPGETIDPYEEWETLGLNNFTINELVEQISRMYSISLKPRLIFQLQNINRLADFISGKLKAQPGDSGDKAVYTCSGDITLADIAFTLQTGREPMVERLALVTADLGELSQKLGEHIQGKSDIEGLFQSNIKSKNESLDTVFSEKEGMDLTLSLLQARKLKALAKLWTAGINIEWHRLYSNIPARRISIPTYPFARERYWIKQKGGMTKTVESRLHNLIDRVVPMLADKSITFEKTFYPWDSIVEHHQVNNQKILPGVGYVAMANAAIKQLFPDSDNCVSRVVWLTPVVVHEEPKAVHLTIFKRGEQLEYEVTSQTEGKKTIHSKGVYQKSLADNYGQYLNLDEIKARCTIDSSSEELYSTYSEMGIQYGEHYRTVKQIWGNSDEALSLLELQAAMPEVGENNYIDTGLLDGALQTILALMAFKGNDDETLRIPFSVDKVEFLGPVKKTMYAYVKAAGLESFNLVLTDEKGLACVRFTELSSRVLSTPQTDISYAFKWVPYPLDQGKVYTTGDRSVIIIHSASENSQKLKTVLMEAHKGDKVSCLCLDENFDGMADFINRCSAIDLVYFITGVTDYAEGWDNRDYLEYSQQYGVVALFRLIKLLASHSAAASKLALKVVTSNTQQVLPGEAIYPLFAGLTGMTKSAVKEYPNWDVSCVDISSGCPNEAFELVNEPAHKNGEDIALRNGRRYLRIIEPVKMKVSNHANFRKGGVYMIIGGAGGIGMTLAGYLVEKYKAHIVLVGRRELTDVQQDKISSVKAKGGNVLYIKADITNLDSMKEAVRSVKKELGAINGVFHSAIVLKDSTINTMDENTLREVMAPKVKGSFVLHKALEGEKLDFIVFFSSAQSFMGNAGQSNYAAACTFKDAYAHYMGCVSNYPVKIINWGYWGSVGVVASEDYRRRLAEKGFLSIEPAEGLEALETFLENPLDQVIVLKADASLKKAMQIDMSNSRIFYKETYKSLFNEINRIQVPQIREPEVVEKLKASIEELRRLTQWLLVESLHKADIIHDRKAVYTLAELKERLRIVPKYDRLFGALLDILERGGFSRIKNNEIEFVAITEHDNLSEILARLALKKEEIITRYPAVKAQVNLLWTCMQNFHQILSGETEATEIMFPGSSMELVEGIYKGNEMADELNKLVAQAIRLFVSSCSTHIKEKRPLTILEIGAGTGGTTKLVLETLKELGIEVRYIYTDISQSFILHGKKTFGSLYPFVDFKVVDIEKDVIVQGLEYNSIDLVIAANVLHATQNLRYTLGQVKTLLRANGWLILNEATQLHDPTTLTFGLLDGWWLYKDEGLRIPHSPLLSANMWETLLKEEGFRQTRSILDEGAQNIVIAESNGEVLIKEKVPSAQTDSPSRQVNKKIEETIQRASDVKTKSIKERILDITARALQAEIQHLNEDSPFTDFGVDSILAVEIVNQINNGLGISLRATDLFNYSSIAALSGYVEEHWGSTLLKSEPLAEEAIEYTPGEKKSYAESAYDYVAISAPAESTETYNSEVEYGYHYTHDTSGHTMPSGAEEEGGLDIAVIGMAGEFPEAGDIYQFWDNLCHGRNSVKKVPASRWNLGDMLAQDKEIYAGQLSDIDMFDPLFFNISPREAEWMDPQQRRFLQTAWNALEDAGYSDKELNGKKCGVFVGCGVGDYVKEITEGVPEAYSFIGNSNSILAARISYLLNLKGPSIAIDTACSSALVAVHLACESLLNGTSEIALAGGVSIPSSPQFHLFASSAGLLSPTGQCRAFDKDADGFIPGEAVGAVILKPLKAAIADGDYIYGIIRGSGLNQDGKSNGITSPNGASQTALEREVYDKYRIDPETITFVEAHGTGTKLGDPIEVHSLTDAFRTYTQKKNYCAIGSVKTNIGHTLTAAGIAGLIKLILCTKYKKLVPSLHYKQENPHLKLEDTPFYVNTEYKDWIRMDEKPRRAAISSFGFSGTNAHMVLEEAPDTRKTTVKRPYYSIPLSAKTQEALEQKISGLVNWLTTEGDKFDLGDIAYTLHLGRSHFEKRAVFIVSDKEQLIEKLRRGLSEAIVVNSQDKKTDFNIHESLKLAPVFLKELVELLCTNDEEFKQKLSTLAKIYVGSGDVDWAVLYPKKSFYRVPLPGYPFAREYYWLEKTEGISTAESNKQLCGEESSEEERVNVKSEENEVTVRKTLLADEYILKDHRALGKPVLPGVGYLELIRNGYCSPKGMGALTFRDIYWISPMIVEEDKREIVMAFRGEEYGWDCRVKSFKDGNELVHFKASISQNHEVAQPTYVKVDHIAKNAQFAMPREEIYPFFDELGLNYGPYFQCIDYIWIGNGEALGALSTLTVCQQDLDNYMLHPGLMDSALQVIVGLVAGRKEGNRGLLMPFSVEKVEVFSPLKLRCYSYVKEVSDNCYNVSIIDEESRLCIQMNNVMLRKAKSTPDTMLYTPLWKRTALAYSSVGFESNTDAPVLIVYAEGSTNLKEQLARTCTQTQIHELLLSQDSASGIKPGDIETLEARIREIGDFGTIYYISGVDFALKQLDDIKSLEESQKVGVYSLFNLVKTLHKLNISQKCINFKIITAQAFAILPGEGINPFSASLAGFALSMSKEFPKWKVSCIDIAEPDLSVAEPDLSVAGIISENITGKEIALRGNQRFIRQLIPVYNHSGAGMDTPFRKGGVYLIVGGAGGIGLELAKYLAEKENARIVLVGRSSSLGDSKSREIDKIKAAGGEITYLQGDITDFDSMTQVVIKTKELYGTINGVFHSAIVLRDMGIVRMSEDDFKAAFNPKVYGSAVLYKALKDEKLDFMVFFSSIQSFVGNVGQSNYAAGSTFKDAFALALRSYVNYPVYTINWGYWGSVGIVSDDSYRKRFEEQGVGSIQPVEGMEAVKQVLNRLKPQIMVLKADEKILKLMGINRDYKVEKLPTIIPSYMGSLVEQLNADAGLAENEADSNHSFEALHQLALKLLVSSFRKMGVFNGVNEAYTMNQLRDKLGITDNYYRLLEAVVDILWRNDIVYVKSGTLLMGQALTSYMYDDMELEQERKHLTEKYPEMRPYIDLLWKAVKSYPDVLTGVKGHMEILFPQGSMHLVEAVYKDNRLADYFNQVVADSVELYVNQRMKDNPYGKINVLEIGSGTGGTSKLVLEKLKGFTESITYYYTDISKGFLEHGLREFGKDYKHIKFKLLNIEKNPLEQGFEPGSMDLLLASNVLHATRLIPTTLDNAKKLLKANGIFIINEATKRQDFATLTFGLTGGWWLFEDPDIRIKGSPLLSVESWEKILTETGFKSISVQGPSGDSSFGQNVIISESDGAILIEDKVYQGIYRIDEKNSGIQDKATPGRNSMEVQVDLQGKVEDYIKNVFAKVLKVKKSTLENNVTFEKYGVDSLIVMEINKEFENDFGKLPTTLLFEYMTVEKLAEYFILEHSNRLEQMFKTDDSTAGNINNVQIPKTETSTSCAEFITKPSAAIPIPGIPVREPATEDIAVIGLGGHYPASADLTEFWSNLKEGRNCITEIPSDRWDWHEYFDSDYRNKGKSYSRWGGFIKDADKFDPLFFNISPREAEAMDPQERLFLETAWETFEDAGYTKKKIEDEGNSVGVFVGVMNPDYELIAGEQWGRNNLTGAHSAYWSVANRVSYVLNLHGPSLTVDTACSSSLTAIHLACESIRRDECKVALAGGINLILHPMHYIRLSGMNMLSKDDKLKSFGYGADGFVDGEGVGALLLKPLSKAIADGNQIYGVIKGSFINSGGKTSGFTVPNPNAQAELIYNAIKRSKVDPATISYIEAHGTGTELGDPIEIAGLHKGFSKASDTELPKQYCAIGTVKSNIGHLESAAGIAGVTKVLLMMKYKKLLPSINCERLNEGIQFEKTPFYIQNKLSTWDTGVVNGKNQPRRAGISSFGAGGANAHVIMEEYVSRKNPQELHSTEKAEIVVLSAKSEQQLKTYAAKIITFIEDLKADSPIQPSLDSVGYTLQTGREAMEHRLALVVSSLDELVSALNMYINEQEDSFEVYTGNVDELKKQLDFLNSDDDSMELVRLWMEKGKLAKVAQLWAKGFDIDWESLYDGRVRPSIVSLPTYPFNKKRYWIKTVCKALQQQEIQQKPLHPLLQSQYKLPLLKDIIFESYINTNTEPYLNDHKVSGKHILSGSAYIAMFMQAIKHVRGSAPCLIEDLVFSNPLELKEDTAERIQLCLSLKEGGGYSSKCIRVLEQAQNNTFGDYILQSGAKVRDLDRLEGNKAGVKPDELAAKCTVEAKAEDYYQLLELQQVELGTSYRWLNKILLGKKQAVAWFKIPEGLEVGGSYELHPGLIDSLFQLAAAAIGDESVTSDAYVPYKVESFKYYGAAQGKELWGYVTVRDEDRNNGRFVFDLMLCCDDTKLVEVQGLDARRVNPKDTDGRLSIIKRGLYKVEWKKQEIISNSGFSKFSNESILVFADRNGFGHKVAECLKNTGQSCIVVHKGDQYRKTNSKTVEINPGVPEHYQRIFEEFSCRDIVYTWALDEENPGNELSADCFEELQALGTYGLLYLAQALSKKATAIKLWVVTQNAQPVGGYFQHLNIVQAPLKGICQVMNYELPSVNCCCLDIESSNNESSKKVVEEILAMPCESIVGWRQNTRYVARISRYVDCGEEEGTIPIYGAKCYIITGGLGDLGLKTAGWIAQRGAKHIILISRSNPSPEAMEVIKLIESGGARVESLQADVSDESALSKVFEKIDTHSMELGGVIHCAGIVDDAFLVQQTADRFKRVMAPKAKGLINLHRLTLNRKLDFFVCYASAASIIGSPGQGSYAAANSVMDALMHQRRYLGLPGISIDWGPWEEAGMAARLKDYTKQRYMSMGIIGISPDEGMDVFGRILKQSEAQVGVIGIDWTKFLKQVPGHLQKGFFANMAELNIESQKIEKQETGESTVEGKLSNQDIDVMAKSVICNILGFEDSQIDTAQPLINLGLDSIMALEISNQIMKKTGVEVPVVRFLEGITADQLIELVQSGLANSVGGQLGIVSPKAEEAREYHEELSAEKAGELINSLGELSEDKIDHILSLLTQDASINSVENYKPEHSSTEKEIELTGNSFEHEMEQKIAQSVLEQLDSISEADIDKLLPTLMDDESLMNILLNENGELLQGQAIYPILEADNSENKQNTPH
ncbi:MAG: SDR family NAD(P)-dependent oxidoreductase [Clostridia bacterium]|nr:SDR family NAD(P)-dependent oxidoreductase [Clostridia bacterium]